MSELEVIEQGVVEMTPEQATEMDQRMCKGAAAVAVLIYIFHTQKGYRHCRDSEGYKFKTFEDYCEDRFEMLRNTAHRWVRRVKATMIVHGITFDDLLKMYQNDTKMPKLLTGELSGHVCKTPQNVAVEAWGEIERSGTSGLNDEKAIIDHWQRAVRRICPPPPRPRVEEDRLWCEACGQGWAEEGSSICSDCEKKAAKKWGGTVDDPVLSIVPNTVNEGPWCAVCGDPIPDGTGAWCEKHKEETLTPVVGFKVEGQSVERVTYAAPTRLVEATRDTPAYLRQTPPEGLTDNGRQVIGAVCAIETDDPEIVYIRCVVPMGMTITEDQLLTVAIVRCQIP